MTPPPPPPPPQMAPPANTYRSARQSELDIIRRKGLAKIFNRHFTSTSDAITREREAADLALQEIERRKEELAKHPKSFTNQVDNTQLDQLCMEIKRRKEDVQRKERETMELYRRYVSQYGQGGYSSVDGGVSNTSCSANFNVNGCPSPSLSTNNNNKSPSTTPFGKMSVLHEDGANPSGDEDIVRQTDVLMARMMERQDLNLRNNKTGNGDDLVGNLTKKLEDGSFYQSQSQSLSSPTAKANTTTTADTMKRLSSPSPTQSQSVSPTVLSNENISYNENQNSKHDTASGTMLEETHSTSFTETSNDNNSFPNKVLEHEEDNDSIMSGLTSIDVATVAEAEWRLTEFLRLETENIRAMFANHEDDDHPPSFHHDADAVTSYSLHSHDGTAGAASSMDGECNSINKYNASSTSRSVSSRDDSLRAKDAATAAEAMAKSMEEASAWMKDPSQLLDEDEDIDEEKNQEEDKEEEIIAEWKGYWSEEYKREYFHNADTNQTCWVRPKHSPVDMTLLGGGKADIMDTTNQNGGTTDKGSNSQKKGKRATIVIDEDESSVVVKDFGKSPSTSSTRKKRTSMSDNLEMIDQYRPNTTTTPTHTTSIDSPSAKHDTASVYSNHSVISGASSKVLEYRRRRNRKRKRRIRRIAALVTLCAIGTTAYCTRETWMPKLGLQTTSMKAQLEQEQAQRIANELEEDRKAKELKTKEEREQRERKKQEEEAKLKEEKERKRKLEEDKKRRDIEAARKAEQERKRKIEEERKRLELEAKREAEKERKQKLEEEKKRKLAEEMERKRLEYEAKIREEERKRVEQEIAERMKREEEEKARKRAEEVMNAKLKAEEERRAVEAAFAKAEAARKAAEEEAARIKVEFARKAAEEEAARIKEEKERKRRIQEEEEAQTRKIIQQQQEEKRRQEEKEASRQQQAPSSAVVSIDSLDNDDNELMIMDQSFKRPKHCNVPFAYIFSKKCNLIAKRKPLFPDFPSFADSMLQ